MTGFLISAIIVIYIVVFVWMFSRAIDGDRVAIVGVCFLLFITFGLVINSIIKTEAKGPCHQYETQLIYNPATKTMMPSRVCVLRGEWIDDEKKSSHNN